MKYDKIFIAAWLTCVMLLGVCGLAHSEVFTAKVIEVLDGDTVLAVRDQGPPFKIRLANIDAPEKAQLFGATSQQSLAGMVMGKKIKITSQAMDQYGRMVAHISVNGLDVNVEQIRRGLAWEYSSFHSDKALIALQNEAKQAPRGLWAQSNPTPPWEWRKLHPSVKSETATATLTKPVAATVTSCGKKKHCSQMVSCEEAQFYYTQCGIKSLDGDGDGTPCENLCAPQQKIKK